MLLSAAESGISCRSKTPAYPLRPGASIPPIESGVRYIVPLKIHTCQLPSYRKIILEIIRLQLAILDSLDLGIISHLSILSSWGELSILYIKLKRFSI